MTHVGIGAPFHRLEDRRLVTGNGRYVDDLDSGGSLHAVFVRSQEAHALISSVDTSEALKSPGVVGVFTAEDLGLARPMPNQNPHPLLTESRQAPPLATGEVCYVGQAVAVVVADDRYRAADAAELVFIDYAPLPAVVDLATAAQPGAPAVNQGSPTNVVATLHAGYGDVDGAFTEADVVESLHLQQHRGACASMEPRGVMASVTDGRLTVWSSTQSPYALQRLLSQYLEFEAIRVVAPDVGGGFGPKAAIYAEEYTVAAIALRLDRAVKWIETRREHLVATNQQRDLIADIEVAATGDGRLLALRGHLLYDNGAFVPYGLLVPLSGLQLVQGPYALGAMDLRLDIVATNAVPTSAVRGAGRPNAAFISERAIDAVARRLGMDRVAIRRRNLIPKDAFPYEFGLAARYGGNITYDSGDYERALDEALTLADHATFQDRKKAAAASGRRIGMGIACYVEDTGAGPHEQARVEITREGRVVITTGAASQGQGHATILAQIAAQQLGVDPTTVEVRAGDTANAGTGIGTIASRTAVTAGSSTFLAATEAAEKLKSLAAARLEASEVDLVLAGGTVAVIGQPDSAISFADLAADDPIVCTEAFPTPRPPYAFGSHVAEVEVDVETGRVTVIDYSVAHDCGTLLNPMIVDGQIDGGVVHGLSNALYERIAYSPEGQPLTTSFMDFRIPTAVEIPRIRKVHTVTTAPDNPLGAKGAGEGGTIPATAAVAAAVEDALSDLGVVVDRYPLLPSVVRDLIETARRGN